MNTSKEEGIELIAYTIFLESWSTDEESVDEFSEDFLKRLAEKWKVHWMPARNGVHCGDCTKVSAPCTRCGVERLFKEATRVYESLYPVPAETTSSCNCAFHRNRQTKGGWTCPIHNHQKS